MPNSLSPFIDPIMARLQQFEAALDHAHRTFYLEHDFYPVHKDKAGGDRVGFKFPPDHPWNYELSMVAMRMPYGGTTPRETSELLRETYAVGKEDPVTAIRLLRDISMRKHYFDMQMLRNEPLNGVLHISIEDYIEDRKQALTSYKEFKEFIKLARELLTILTELNLSVFGILGALAFSGLKIYTLAKQISDLLKKPLPDTISTRAPYAVYVAYLKFVHELSESGIFYNLYSHNDFFKIIDMLTSAVPFMKKISRNEFSNRLSEGLIYEIEYYVRALGQSRYSSESLDEIDVFHKLTELDMQVASVREAIGDGLDDELRNGLLRSHAPTLKKFLADIQHFLDCRSAELGKLPRDLVVILSDPKVTDAYSIWRFMGAENTQDLLIAKLREKYKDLKEFCDGLKLDDLPPSPPSTPSSERTESPMPEMIFDDESTLLAPSSTPNVPSRSLTRSAPP